MRPIVAPIVRILSVSLAKWGINLPDETILAAYVAVEAVVLPIAAAVIARRKAAKP